MKLGSPAAKALAALIALIAAVVPTQSHANDMTARDVTVKIYQTPEGERADFSDLVLTLIDLSRLDFKKAILVGADLYGTDLSYADLSGTDLTYTRLDRTTTIGTNFSGADLSDATILRPSSFSSTSFDRSEVADFTGAKLVRTRVFARLGGASFRKADLTDADFRPLSSGANTISVVPFNILSGADFTDSTMRGANLEQVKLEYAIFRNADLRDVDFRAADLTGSDFTGADITGANFSGAIVKQAILTGVKGLQSARGLGIATRPQDAELTRP